MAWHTPRRQPGSEPIVVGAAELAPQGVGGLPVPLRRPDALRAAARHLTHQPDGANVGLGREEDARRARLGDPLHLSTGWRSLILGGPRECAGSGATAVAASAGGAGNTHLGQPFGQDQRSGSRNRRVVWNRDHGGVVAPKEGDEQVEAGRVEEHGAVTLPHTPLAAKCYADGHGSLSQLVEREARFLRAIVTQPGVEPP